MTKVHLMTKTLACALALIAQGAWAHSFIAVQSIQPKPVPREELLFSMPQNPDHPKLWTQMSARERADIWPYLDRSMQRHYWRMMGVQEKQELKALLTPRQKEMMRSRFVSPHRARCEHPPAVNGRHLSDEQRVKMREQIRQTHIEIYRFKSAPKPPGP